MSKVNALEAFFREGFEAASDAVNPYLYSSDAFEAFAIGQLQRKEGRFIPVRKSRGGIYRNDTITSYRVQYSKGEFSVKRGS